MIKIIDNKKINVTNDEWELYQKIVKSYTTLTNKGEDLFIDLFETDDNGWIKFLKPPSQRQISFEIFLFLMSLMIQQQLRNSAEQLEELATQFKDKIKEVDQKLQLLENK